MPVIPIGKIIGWPLAMIGHWTGIDILQLWAPIDRAAALSQLFYQ